MIDREEARLIALHALEEKSTGAPMALAPGEIDHGDYWVFPYNSAKYYETYSFEFLYVGAGPIAVAKADGRVRFLHGNRPFEEQLEGGEG